jgi:hypothetical protein
MARNTTLSRLLDMYRAECRMSLNVAHNNQDRDRQVNQLQMTQEWLWEDFDWPLLRVDRQVSLAAGQRYYEPPEDLHIDRIDKIEVFHDSAYQRLTPGIEDVHYTAYNSNLDERQWPPQRWRLSEDEQIEIWPIPDGNANLTTLEGTLRITGIRKLRPLVDDSDRADLDDQLIVLWAAAEYLATTGDKAANLKLEKAKTRYAKLRGAQMPRKRMTLFGIEDMNRNNERRIPIAVYNKAT